MTKQEIREIIENEINLRDATPNQVNKSVKLILASHLRSQIVDVNYLIDSINELKSSCYEYNLALIDVNTLIKDKMNLIKYQLNNLAE